MLKQNRFGNIACPAGFSSLCAFFIILFYFFCQNKGRGGPPLQTWRRQLWLFVLPWGSVVFTKIGSSLTTCLPFIEQFHTSFLNCLSHSCSPRCPPALTILCSNEYAWKKENNFNRGNCSILPCTVTMLSLFNGVVEKMASNVEPSNKILTLSQSVRSILLQFKYCSDIEKSEKRYLILSFWRLYLDFSRIYERYNCIISNTTNLLCML